MKRRRHRRWIAWLLAAGILLTVAAVRLDAAAQPVVQDYGKTAARRASALAVQAAVERVLADGGGTYDELCTVVRDDAGQVLSVEAQPAAVNRLKAAVTAAVTEELDNRAIQSVSIPLGSVIGGSFFTGRGPFLPVSFSLYGTALSDMHSEFSSAGINQTLHSLSLTVTVEVTAVLPGKRLELETVTTVPLCETVLLGTVPQVNWSR